jgi:outer membrane protein insertion porin family
MSETGQGGWRFVLSVLIIITFLPLAAPGQQVVGKVNVLIDGQPADETMVNLVGLKPGDSFSDYQLDQILKRLMRTGLYASGIIYRSEEPQPEVTFSLTRNTLIKELKISAPAGLIRVIKKRLPYLREGSIIDQAVKDRAVKEIEQILQEEGWFSSEIEFELEKLENSNLAEVRITLNDSKRLTVGEVEFEGKNILPAGELERLFGVKPGDFYVPKKLSEGVSRIKKAYNELGYRWAEIRLTTEPRTEAEGQVNLRIFVDPSVRIHLEIIGANLPVKLIQPVWEQKVFEEWALAEGEAVILKHLRKKGYIFATVRSKIEKKENDYYVTYQVHQGTKLKIKEVQFKGNQAFDEKSLKKALGIGDKVLFFPYLDGQEIYELPEKVSSFYKRQGFPLARANLNFVRQDNSVTPIIYIEEGPRQIIKSLEIQGNKAVQTQEIMKEIEARPGRQYYQPDLQRDLEKINLLYLNQGFRGTEVRLEATPDKDNNFDLVIKIAEGRRMKVDNIFISGHQQTSRSLIEKEIKLKPGDWAQYDRLLETKRGLDNLGIFSEVKVEELAASPESVNISIQVREGEQNYGSLGLGLETREEVRTIALWQNGLRPRITAEYIGSNFFHNASQFSLVGQLSLIDKRLVGTYQQPYIFGIKMRTLLSGYLEREERTSFGYARQGFSLSTMRNLPGDFSLALAGGMLKTWLTHLEIDESQVERERLPYSIAYGSMTFIRDTRNDTFNPESGYFFSLALERAYPLFSTESDFSKLFAKFQYFYPLSTNANFYTTVRFGLASGLVPIPERFFAGGSNSFRGASFEMLGPLDPESGLPLGGKSVFLFNMEARFRLMKKIPGLYGAIFYDMGNVFAEMKDFNFLELKQAVGLGLRLKTPLGPIRFDMGWNLNATEKKWKPLFFLTIGNMF